MLGTRVGWMVGNLGDQTPKRESDGDGSFSEGPSAFGRTSSGLKTGEGFVGRIHHFILGLTGEEVSVPMRNPLDPPNGIGEPK